MNMPVKAAIMVIALCSSGVAMADARLQVEIVPGTGRLGEASVALKLVNVGDQRAMVPKSSLPAVNGRGMLLDDPFIVKQQDGREVEFFGIMRDTLPEAPSFLSIPAGGSFSLDMDLAKSYRLSPGLSYTIGLRAPISYRSGEGRNEAAGSLQQQSSKWTRAYPAARTIVVPVAGRTMERGLADELLEPVVCTDPEGTPSAEQKSSVFQSVTVRAPLWGARPGRQ